MKKTLLPINLFLFLLILGFTSFEAGAQAVLYENFDYAVPGSIGGNGAAGTSLNNWTTHSVTTGQTTTVDLASGNLSYTGLQASAGNKVYLFSNANATSRDINREFTSASTVLYFSALINIVDNSQITTTGDYFMHIGATAGTAVTIFGGRLGVKSVNTGANYRFMILNTSGGTTTYTELSQDMNFGTTYLVVVKYDRNVAPTIATLWVNPSPLSSTEPAGGVTNSSGTGTFAAFSSICLRNSSTTPKAEIDEIRVGSTFADVTPGPPDVTAPVPAYTPANSATDVKTWVKPVITFDEPVRKTDGTALTDGDLSSIIILKKTDASGTAVPFTATIDAAKKVITITPAASLDNSQLYYLSTGPVEDANGNESTVSSITFTTINSTSPVLTLTYPVGGETMYAGQANTITWNSANITNLLIEVWVLDGSSRVWTWIPFIPTTPAAPGKIDIVVPADALYGTEYKIRISDLSNPAVSCMSGNFTIIAVATSITDLRQRCIANDIVKLSSEATVTFLRTLNRNQKYIQDAGAGLLIDDASSVLTTTIALGDNIKNLEGKLGLYGGALQIVPTVSTVTIASGGNTVTIPEMTLAQYMTNYLQYESELIKISNLIFNDGNGTATFAASSNYNITDGTNTVVFRTFLAGEGNIVGSVIPQSNISAVLIGGFFNTTIQVYGRNTSDFSVATGIEKGNNRSLVIYPIPATSVLNLKNISNVNTIEILDVTGKIVIRMENVDQNEVRIPVSNLRKGMYFIKVTTPEGKIIKRFIKS